MNITSPAVPLSGDLPATKQIPNGAPVRRTFSDTEYQRRQSDLRRIMAGLDLEAALFTSIHNIAYYSDFLYCSFGRPYGLVATPQQVTDWSKA